MSLGLGGELERKVREIPVATASGHAVVRVGTLRASAGWRGGPGRVLGAIGLSLPLGVAAGGVERTVWSSGRRPGLARALFAFSGSPSQAPAPASAVGEVAAGARKGSQEEPPMDADSNELDFLHRPAAYPAEHIGQALTAAASGAGAVGPVTTVGDRAVFPLTETMFSGGFGTGGGGGTESGKVGGGSGGGGGGAGRSRTIAIAVIGPDGVEVRPVIDGTGLALAALTTFCDARDSLAVPPSPTLNLWSSSRRRDRQPTFSRSPAGPSGDQELSS